MGATENNHLEQRIIETAQQLFIEKGFTETSMSDIAHTVGINRTTLHYYFRTKDKMFQAVFNKIITSIIPRVHDILTQDIPFIERIDKILDEYIMKFTENPFLPKFIFGEIQRDVNHLLHNIKELNSDKYFEALKLYLYTEMQQGKLKKVPLHFVFLTFYGLLAYPMISKNLLVTVFLNGKEENFTPMLQEWKQYIIEQMKHLLCYD